MVYAKSNKISAACNFYAGEKLYKKSSYLSLFIIFFTAFIFILLHIILNLSTISLYSSSFLLSLNVTLNLFCSFAIYPPINTYFIIIISYYMLIISCSKINFYYLTPLYHLKYTHSNITCLQPKKYIIYSMQKVVYKNFILVYFIATILKF